MVIRLEIGCVSIIFNNRLFMILLIMWLCVFLDERYDIRGMSICVVIEFSLIKNEVINNKVVFFIKIIEMSVNVFKNNNISINFLFLIIFFKGIRNNKLIIYLIWVSVIINLVLLLESLILLLISLIKGCV